MTRCPECTATVRFYANAIAEIEIDRQNANRERDAALAKLARLRGDLNPPTTGTEQAQRSVVSPDLPAPEVTP